MLLTASIALQLIQLAYECKFNVKRHRQFVGANSSPSFSSPSNSTPVNSSVIFQSCIFPRCDFVRQIQLSLSFYNQCSCLLLVAASEKSSPSSL